MNPLRIFLMSFRHYGLILFVTTLLSSVALGQQANTAQQNWQVPADGWLRLPAGQPTLQLPRLQVGAGGNLLVPAAVTSLTVETLDMAPGARLSVAPRPSVFVLTVERARLADGSLISVAGADGDLGEPGGPGTDLQLQIASGQLANLTIDARGGRGGDGWNGEAGAKGRDAACWGRSAGDGEPGLDGGDGQDGGRGARVTLALPDPGWLEVIDVLLSGGAGGLAGAAGRGGEAGARARCWLYSLGGEPGEGRGGRAGVAGVDGEAGTLSLR